MGVSSSSSVTDADGSANVDTDEHTVVHGSSDNRNTVYSLLLSWLNVWRGRWQMWLWDFVLFKIQDSRGSLLKKFKNTISSQPFKLSATSLADDTQAHSELNQWLKIFVFQIQDGGLQLLKNFKSLHISVCCITSMSLHWQGKYGNITCIWHSRESHGVHYSSWLNSGLVMKYFVENVEEQWRFASSSSSETTVVAVILVILNQILPFLGAFFPVTLTQLLYGADVKTNAGLIRSCGIMWKNRQTNGGENATAVSMDQNHPPVSSFRVPLIDWVRVSTVSAWSSLFSLPARRAKSPSLDRVPAMFCHTSFLRLCLSLILVSLILYSSISRVTHCWWLPWISVSAAFNTH